MESLTRFQIMDKAICVSFGVNALGEGMSPSVLPLAIGN